MSERGASAGRRRSRRSARPESRVKRSLVAIGTVLLVITPISWILLHEPQSDPADAAIPYVDRMDDTYITPTNEPVAATKTPKPKTTSPTPSSTPTPSGSETPGKTPSTSPTDGPTTVPTDGPGDTKTPKPPRTGSSAGPKPTSRPTPTATTTTPVDAGNMSGDELQLFSLIDSARTDRGCAPLRRNSDLSDRAGNDAEGRASKGNVNDGGSTMAAAGGDDWDAQKAFEQMMNDNADTVLNCGLSELGVGRESAEYCPVICIGGLGKATRVSWVADFN